jgi:AP-1 complex subunit beta-1
MDLQIDQLTHVGSQDATHHNPLIRALAVRTMGCIRVERITEYLEAPLKKALSDEDPYVRKTAAICVAKLHDISPPLVREHGFLDLLRELLNDANPTVVANAVAALTEIQQSYPETVVFEIPPSTLLKLLAALNECTEWGQVYILDALALLYTPTDAREAESAIERVLPRLAHQNSAVVLSAVKIVLLYMEHITNEETLATYRRKLAPPLVTLAQSSQPEIQYIALRNIALVVQKEPFLLTSKVKVFFCKYNDPIYVKMEKLEILVQLVNDRNVDNVLSELKEYATEVDVEYVRRAVRTIGRCAIKLEAAAEKCIKVLLTLIETKVNYVVQEAIVVIKDIFRKYPNRYEAVISALCENLDTLDEPEAKASMIWIIGEYAERIQNADELLDTFVDGFHDEPATVQLALLTATVKLFLKKPDTTEDLVQAVLAMAAEESDNPDLRDRGYIYWRLLSADPDAANAVVLAEKPVIHDDSSSFGRDLLNELISNLSTLASVFHKPPDSFVKRRDAGTFEDEDDDDDSEEDGGEEGEDASVAGSAAGAAAASDDLDILDLMGGATPMSAATPSSQAARTPAAPGSADDDLFGLSTPASAHTPAASSAVDALSLPVVADASGIKVHASVVAGASGTVVLHLGLENSQSSAMDKVAIAVNKNSFGLSPTAPVSTASVAAGGSGSMSVDLVCKADRATGWPLSATVDVALRDNTSRVQVIFKVPLTLDAVIVPGGGVTQSDFIPTWGSIEASNQEATVRGLRDPAPNAIVSKLQAAGFSVVARRDLDPTTHVVYATASTLSSPSGSANVLAELKFKTGFNGARVSVRSATEGVSRAGFEAVSALITA